MPQIFTGAACESKWRWGELSLADAELPTQKM
jgi:hypothetical protein